MDRPLVSVIIPVYNGERYLAFALQSIFEQDYHPFEVIVVDDGSVDHSADIAQSYKNIQYIYQSNQGHAMAKNVGISAARGKFIAFLDADDLWTPNKLSVQVAYLLKYPLVGYTIAKQEIFVEPGTKLSPWLQKDVLLKPHTAFIPSTLVARRSVFEQIGNFDSSYRHSNDSDWFFRARDAGILMGIVPVTLLRKRFHSSNLSYETKAIQSELLKVVKSSIDRQRNQKSGKTANSTGNGSDGK